VSPPQKEYTPDVQLDALMVLAGMDGGPHGIFGFAFQMRHIFSGPDDALARADWLRRQPKEYLDLVSARAVEIDEARRKKREAQT